MFFSKFDKIIIMKQLLLILLLSLFLFSCKKNQVGGSITVKGLVSHHGVAIPNAYVYIKYNTLEFPGDDVSIYNSNVQADANGNYSIPFYKGSYYLYAKGLDYTMPSPYIVKGGLSLSITSNGNLTKDIAVSE